MKEKDNSNIKRTEPEPIILKNRVSVEQVQKVSEDTGIPARVFINALVLNKDSFPKSLETGQNIIPDDGETERAASDKLISSLIVDEARDAFRSASENSEAEQFALEEWNDLSLKQAVEASTVEEAKSAYDQSPNGSKAQRVAVLKIFYLANNK